MHPIVPWLPLLLIPVFVAFLGLISAMLARMGWSRLAKQYATAEVPATLNRELLTYLRIGRVNYKNAVRAGITPQGVWLTTWKLFYIGHPPLFIPWSAFGPVQADTFLWATTYATHISCGDDDPISFQFSSERLRSALPSSLAVQE